MAEKSASDEKILNISLGKGLRKVHKNRRANKAISVIKFHLSRHMKTDSGSVRISQPLHDKIWSRGIQKPPSKVKVKVRKEGEVVFARLPEEKEVKKEEKGKLGLKEKLIRKKEPEGKETDTKEEKKEERKIEPKTEEKAKEEIKEKPKEEAVSEKPDEKPVPKEKK